MAERAMTLDDLERGRRAHVSGFRTLDPELETKLREIGFAEGDEVELLQRGLIGGTPVSIRLNRTMIALRKSEAMAILVDLPE